VVGHARLLHPPSPAIEPSEAECAAITNLDTLFEWARIDIEGGFRASLVSALGTPTVLRDLGSITQGEWEAMVSELMIAPPSDADGEPAEVAASTLQKSRVRLLRVCYRKVLGLTSEILPIAPAIGVDSPAIAPAGAGQSLKKIKLSSLVDVTAEAELILLDPITLRTMFGDYETMMGEAPHEDVEPTSEQLSAVCLLFNKGKCRTPCAFSRLHKCSTCGANHPATDCSKQASTHARGEASRGVRANGRD
jgi:hypothetical protein